MAFSEDASISHDITTDAGFRAWAQKVHDALSAVGMVQTSDTGQINLTTVTTPGTNNTTAGYEIWRFNDSEQSGDPIFFKLEYGRGSAAAYNRIIFTPGKGSNGSGTITTAGTARTLSQSVTPGATGRVIASFYQGALFLLSVAAPSSTTLGYWLLLERMRDSAGAIVSGDIAAVIQGASASASLYTSGAWNNSPTVFVLGGTLAASGKVWIAAIRIGNLPAGPLRGLLLSRDTVIGADDTGSLTINGTAIDYKRINVAQTFGVFDWAGSGQPHNYLCQNEV